MKKNILISGGSSGIGYALSKKLLEKGHIIYMVSRNAKDCDLTKHSTCVPYNIDVKNIDTLCSSIDSMVSKNSITHIDILINCAGVGYGTPLKTVLEKEYDHIMNTNVKGLIFLTKKIIPFMKDGSVICNISSIAGIRGFTEWGVYCASKFAVEGFTKALRDEVRPLGIKVMCIRPGATNTHFYESLTQEETKDFMSPETIADVIIASLFLEKNACAEEIFINNSIGDI